MKQNIAAVYLHGITQPASARQQDMKRYSTATATYYAPVPFPVPCLVVAIKCEIRRSPGRDGIVPADGEL